MEPKGSWSQWQDPVKRILIRINPAPILTLWFFKAHLFVILISSNCPLTFMFSEQNFVCLLMCVLPTSHCIQSLWKLQMFEVYVKTTESSVRIAGTLVGIRTSFHSSASERLYLWSRLLYEIVTHTSKDLSLDWYFASAKQYFIFQILKVTAV